jgi:hypothetical protein
MAEPILHKSPPEDANKNDLKLNSEICLNRAMCLLELVNSRDSGYLPGIGSHFITILETTVSNLTHLHNDLSKIEEMLKKGGNR